MAGARDDRAEQDADEFFEKSSDLPLLKAALIYAAAGLAVFPLNPRTAGAVFRHGFVEDYVEWLLDPDKRSASAAHTKPLAASHSSRLLECTQCGAVRVSGEPCFHCGFLPQRLPRAVDIDDGELGLVDQHVRRAKAKLYDSAERTRWYAMLIHVAMERGYKAGWAAYMYKEKFGTWPPWGSSPRPISPLPEVRSWVRSRYIAYAKRRGAA